MYNMCDFAEVVASLFSHAVQSGEGEVNRAP